MQIRNAKRAQAPSLSTSIESDLNFLNDLLLFNQIFLISTVVQGTRVVENLVNPTTSDVERARRNYEYFKIEEKLGSALAESGYHPHQYAYLLDNPEFTKSKDWYINTFLQTPELQLISEHGEDAYGLTDIQVKPVVAPKLDKINKSFQPLKST